LLDIVGNKCIFSRLIVIIIIIIIIIIILFFIVFLGFLENQITINSAINQHQKTNLASMRFQFTTRHHRLATISQTTNVGVQTFIAHMFYNLFFSTNKITSPLIQHEKEAD
jgi:signal transduction histidine kinase